MPVLTPKSLIDWEKQLLTQSIKESFLIEELDFFLTVKKFISFSIPAIIITVKMKGWVDFHITT